MRSAAVRFAIVALLSAGCGFVFGAASDVGAPDITVACYYFGQYHPNDPRDIHCWNEWTEGSYLEPDTVSGFRYLDAVKRVFDGH